MMEAVEKWMSELEVKEPPVFDPSKPEDIQIQQWKDWSCARRIFAALRQKARNATDRAKRNV